MLDVIGEISVLITNKAQTFHWEGYGLKLLVPPGALPPGMKQCELLIKVEISGQFTFPKNTSLVSAVYWLHSEPQCEFSQPLTLEIQHCATSSQTSRLTFAKCSDTSLPYNFDILEGGDFSEDGYGCIQLQSFSRITVLKWLTWLFGLDDLKYHASIYHLWKGENRREIHFVVTKDLEAHDTVRSLRPLHCCAKVKKNTNQTLIQPATALVSERVTICYHKSPLFSHF